ncbi:MarR family winged helix-turn-helix transcriptional regulator [Streptomyces sp. WI04-05B]|uniref:MarR family winged helix-turn-helix transcriptional regulator n=1 Tax=Streptomyces TaxID=1883 RepID=UPI0029B991C2|nr:MULTISPECIES: MarR family transcriptional regulator [unclassified Streptomyces]MDX2549127.1 MarR family transcriptional regulator [Streptomyces sp. WI04-05B]MDX2590645.1 MarR family transcriptional regulator [Streptomyces sp. WI04-05A]MDX3745715.1 MarR family transcriptional regulator [Streptomyces sp. AK08-02]
MVENRPVKRTRSAPAGEDSPGAQAESAGGGEAAEPIRWLTEEELHAWMALAGMVTKLPAALDRQLQRDAGLTHFEYQVLVGLSRAPERTLRMSELADFTGGQLPRLSQVATRMERRGWLTRRPDPTDGRYTLACLTDAGTAKLELSAPGHVTAVRRLIFDCLSPAQVRQMAQIARRIAQAAGSAEFR